MRGTASNLPCPVSPPPCLSPPPPPAATVEDGVDKDKKRRRRSNRRNKQNSVSAIDQLQLQDGGDTPDRAEGGDGGNEPLDKASHVAFSSTPNLHLDSGECAKVLEKTSKLTLAASPDSRVSNFSKSCPLPGAAPSGMRDPTQVIPSVGNGAVFNYNKPRKQYLDPHWSEEEVLRALEKGHAFRAKFRVNAYNPEEAYCTVDGLPIDILLSGPVAQNRAIEGDVVAITLDPVYNWTRLKGATAHCSEHGTSPVDNSNVDGGQGEGVDLAGKANMYSGFENASCSDTILPVEQADNLSANNGFCQFIQPGLGKGHGLSHVDFSGSPSRFSHTSNQEQFSGQSEFARSLERVCATINLNPSKRPTGRVIYIIEHSYRRDTVVGFLSIQQDIPIWITFVNPIYGQVSQRSRKLFPYPASEYIVLRPNNSRLPNLVLSVAFLPESIMSRVEKGDLSLEKELIVAQIDKWTEETLLPEARVTGILGLGEETETQLSAILLENKICCSEFSSESLSCVPDSSWRIPLEEFQRRKDLRNLCTFTIDPASATDLDDALSVERISDDVFRIGVHIADVSFFVVPGSALDDEARNRSTAMYLLQNRVPMLPPLLSERLGSLVPGVDRLTFSIIWDVSLSQGIISQWIGRSIIHSCCKLSYECAQDIIDETFTSNSEDGSVIPAPHTDFEWKDIIESVMILHKISKALKENRFKDGALWLDNAKLTLLFDQYGAPCDGLLYDRKDAHFLVEEFMLLANKSVAEVISRAFPERSLLRRHPEPNLRKLKEFKTFWSKHGFEIDVSSSYQLHISLSRIREQLKDDTLLFDVLVSYALKPMQLAEYFCTGDFRDCEHEWAHYSLAVPCYTHFTSPLRRYPDIVVHRILLAVLEAEEMYLQRQSLNTGGQKICQVGWERCFTGMKFDACELECNESREALSAAALKYNLPDAIELSEIAAHCNERKLASRNAEEAGVKLYLWALLKAKEDIVCEARVMGLGPNFMSVYVHKLSMERRIHYTEVDGLTVDWLGTTSVLILDTSRTKQTKRNNLYQLEDVAWVVNPCQLNGCEEDNCKALPDGHRADPISLVGAGKNTTISPAVFPLTLRLLSTVPVVLHAMGGDYGPVDIGVRLYMASY